MSICIEKMRSGMCREKVMRGHTRCKWHMAANRVHQASDKAWKRHAELSDLMDEYASTEDDYSEESAP